MTRSPVVSYAFTDPASGNHFIVNVTQPGHDLHPGYLARWVSSTPSGTVIHNFGEGLALEQAQWNPLGQVLNSVWGPSAQALAEKCACTR